MERVIPRTGQYVVDGYVRCDNAFIPTELGILLTKQDELNSYIAYLTWLTDATHGSDRIIAARNGFWLGLPICGSSYQCLVSCEAGGVAGCWDTSAGFGSFGDVYNIAGQNYQIYDPIQLALAGLTPNGGSFPLLSSNPITGRTANAEATCDTRITITTGSNCLTPSGAGSTPYCASTPNIGPSQHFSSSYGFLGDYRGKSFSIGESCSYVGNNIDTVRYALGGSRAGTTYELKTLNEVGIDGVHASCGHCTKHLSEKGYGVDCCNLSYGTVTISGAPSWNGSGWSSGGEIWNNFWSSNSDDNNFRVSEQTGDCLSDNSSTCWGTWRSSCGVPQTHSLANSRFCQLLF
jgi:hypothetical protein